MSEYSFMDSPHKRWKSPTTGVNTDSGYEMNNDLISRKALKEYAQKLLVGESINTYFGINLYKTFEEIIDHTPTVESKRGKWIKTDGNSFECEFCHRLFDIADNYCGYCGAQMQKGGAK